MVKIDHERCDYLKSNCSNCVEVCPTSALKKEDMILIDESRCVDCCLCITACPNNAIKAA